MTPKDYLKPFFLSIDSSTSLKSIFFYRKLLSAFIIICWD